MSGYRGLLIGDKFMDHWREDNVGSFYRVMKATMPRGGAGSLGDAAYLDIMAYILQANGFPAGKEELTLPALDGIRIEGEDGPQPVPEFALVKTVGCLRSDAAGEWKLERATPAVRTRDPQPSPESERVAEATAAGDAVVKFLHVSDYDAERFHMAEQRGHKVEAKGFLIRNSQGPTLNLTSVGTVAGSCP